MADRHYRHLASRYDEFLRWSPDFLDRHATRIIECLRLSTKDRLVDLACGTGIYAQAILERISLDEPIIGVDPSIDMLAEIPEDVRITPVVADAVAFSERPGRYDKVLLKEAIHHVEDRPRLFDNLAERLPAGGRFLLVHVNPARVAYPLFDAALERCTWWFADPATLSDELTRAGFNVEHEQLVYDHRVPRDHYFEMVEHRYMSVLTSFDADEMAAGLQQMQARYADHDVLEFPETFDYLVACRR